MRLLLVALCASRVAALVAILDPGPSNVSVITSGKGGFPSGWLDAGDRFGCAVGRVGAVGADGTVDFVVGAPWDDDAASNAGAVYILQTAAQTTVKRAFKITKGRRGFAENLGAEGHFGHSADGIGDVDGNGVPDIAVGAPGSDGTGEVFVVLMDAGVHVSTTVRIASGKGGFAGELGAHDFFGSGLAGVGDVDRNGVPDIAVGAYGDDTGASGVGAVYVLRLTPTGHVSSHTKITNALGGLSSSLVSGDWFGYRVAALGDVNGDGVPDVAVGAHGTDRGGQSAAGSVYVLHLASDGTVSHDHEITSHTSGFGRALAEYEHFASPSRVGDVDGDGIDDLAVGAWGSNSVYVLLMDRNGLVRDNHQISNVGEGDFGVGVSSVEREHGASLLVGAPATDKGKVYVVDLPARPWPSGSASGIAFTVAAGVGAVGLCIGAWAVSRWRPSPPPPTKKARGSRP